MNGSRRSRRKWWALPAVGLALLWGAPPAWAAGPPTAVSLQVQPGGEAWILNSGGYQAVEGQFTGYFAAPGACAGGCTPQLTVTVEGGGAAVVDGWNSLPVPGLPGNSGFSSSLGVPSSGSGTGNATPLLVVQPPITPLVSSSLPATGVPAANLRPGRDDSGAGALVPGDTVSYPLTLTASSAIGIVGQSVTLTTNYTNPGSIAAAARADYAIVDTTSGQTVAQCAGACTATVTASAPGSQTYQALAPDNTPVSAPVTIQWTGGVQTTLPPGVLTNSAPLSQSAKLFRGCNWAPVPWVRPLASR